MHSPARRVVASFRPSFWLAVAAAWLLAPGAGRTRAEAPRALAGETREYQVFVKGKPAGKTTIQIAGRDDGTTTAATNASIEFRILLFTYRYEFHGSEVWRGDRLERVDSRAVDDGKKLATRATIAERDSRIEADGKPARQGPLLRMTTNYWRRPPVELDSEFAILEADTGVVHRVRLKRVGVETIDADGRRIPCIHYRLSGTTAAELWFNDRDRMVQQETVEDGYKTELRLTQIRGDRDERPR